MHRHQRHPIRIRLLAPVHVGKQGHLLHEGRERSILVGDLLLALHEVLDAIDQLLYVFIARHILRVGRRAHQRKDPRLAQDLVRRLERIEGRSVHPEGLDHRRKGIQLGPHTGLDRQLRQPIERSDHLEHTPSVVVGRHDQFVERRLSDAPRRVIDHTQERLLVLRIDSQAHVRQRVLDLLARIEGLPAPDAVRDIVPPQGVFDGTALGIGAVEHGKILVTRLRIVLPQGFDGPGDVVSFVPVGEIAHHPHRFAGIVGRPDILVELVAVFGDHAVGRPDDVLGRTVILLQLEDPGFGVVAVEV